MNRRTLLATGAALVSGSFAGCGGDEDGSPAATTTSEPATERTSEPTETASPTPTSDPGTDGTPDPTESAASTPTSEPDGTEELLPYGELYSFEPNYAVEVEYSDPETGQSGTGTAKYHDGDYYMQIEPDGVDDTFEKYGIDDDTYLVINGADCYLNPGSGMEPDANVESASDAETHGRKPDEDLTPAGTTEIDGEPVNVYEVSGDDIDGTLTLSVSVSTGYVRRVEGAWGTADFHSWGEIDPISPPDMDCQEVLYGTVYSFEPNYAVDIEYSDPENGQSGSASGRYYGDDYYMRIEPDDVEDTFEKYFVDDDTYLVINEAECVLNPGSGMEPDADVESETDAEARVNEPDPDLKPDGTTDIDGETVYIYEVTGEDIDGSRTFYVSVSTGYVRRVEGPGGTVDFHSWGEIDPISPPDLDCREIGT